MKKHIQNLHERALNASKRYLQAESDLVQILGSLNACRGYRDLGCRSLFEYAKTTLGLSKDVAYNLIVVARKAQEVPALYAKMESKEITLSNARMLTPILTEQNQQKWLGVAASLSKRQLEKEIAREYPKKVPVPETARYVSESLMELKMGISEDLFLKLKRVQDVLSSKTQAPASLEEAIEAMAENFLNREDPLRKAERHALVVTKRIQKPVPVLESSADPRFIPARVEHAVTLRDQAQCTEKTASGERCPERRWLHIHHIVPVSQGGKSVLENLTLLCAAHHRWVHR